MASNENQSVQIALIVFVILTLILVVTTYLSFRGYQEADTRAETESNNANQAKQALRTAQDQIATLLQSIGVETSGNVDQDLTAAKGLHEEDMKKLSETFHQEQQTYHDAVVFLSNSVQETNSQLAAAQDKIRELEARNESREQIKQGQVDEFVSKAQDAAAELAKADQSYTDDRRRLNAMLQDLEQKRQKAQTGADELRTDLSGQIDTLTKELESIRQIADQRKKTIENLDPDKFDAPDGQVARVDQRRGLVWINLGSGDRLRPQITFSVFGPHDTAGGRTVRKGAIEVTRILSSDIAEARVIDDTISNPILPGDKIFTPLWRPGQRQHFAIAGWIDLDGDERSDRGLIRDLIRMAGGIIDGELGDDGKQSGKLTLQTRYLIVGVEREDNAELLGQWKSRARDLGVRQLTVDKFLDLIGWKNTRRVLDFAHGRPSDFRPATPDGGRPTSNTNLGKQFKARRPPTSGTGRRRGY